MNKNLSMEKRTSFNRPIAESTLRTSISNTPTFQWGRKNLNNSTESSPGRSPVREKTNGLSKIDARIYADVHSRGLTSRIVKYENSSRLNRSISMNNLTSEVKKYPATRSTKPELAYKSTTQNVSMTHIAPPDKSAFYGNTLSGLLRSSSVISLQHNDDDLSSENRPIIHPPGTEKELQPTRSVLEVLKEISRKRINNEDADEADTSKKYCNRFDSDINNGTIQPDYRSIQQLTQQTYKRQRECANDCYNMNIKRIEQNAYISKTTTSPITNHTETSSPEQQQHAKRRQHCNYNNDITSSLSSSKKCINKRKLFEYESDTKQQEKQIRFQPEVRLPELSTTLNYVAKIPITPIPNTPQTNLTSNDIIATSMPTLVHKSITAPVAATTEALVINNIKPHGVDKPKLTLFNKDYESRGIDGDAEINNVVDVNENNVDDKDPYAGIPFVKPKKSATTIGGSASHLLMERTQKSKLALMLSGLRGELYLGDNVDGENKTNDKITTKERNSTADKDTTDNNKINYETTMTTNTATITTTTATTTNQPVLTTNVTPIAPITPIKSNTNIVDGQIVSNTGFSLPNTKQTTTISTPNSTKILSPLTGIKLTPQTTTIVSTTSTTTPTPTVAVIAPAFNFGINTATTTTTLSTTTSTQSAINTISNSTTPFTFGTLPQATDATNLCNETSVPTFGAANPIEKPRTTISNPTSLSNIATTPVPTFSFGAKTTATASITPQAAPIMTTKSPQQLFSFGNPASQPQIVNSNTTTTIAVPSIESTKIIATTTNTTPFSFGLNTSNAVGFNFGGKETQTTNATTITTVAPKMFNFTSPNKTSNTTTTGGFPFNVAAAENKAIATPNLFGSTSITPIKFGANASNDNNNKQHNQQQQQQPNTTINNLFNFGSKPSVEVASSKTFGAFAENNNQNKMFNFGAANTSTTTSTTEPTKTTNIFNLTRNNATKSLNFGISTANNNSAAPATTITSNAFTLANNNNNNTNNNKISQQNLFSFGDSDTTKPAEAPKLNNNFNFGSGTQNKPFSFGATNVETPKLTFGVEQKKGFSFGGANNSTIATTVAPIAQSATTAAASSNTFTFNTSNQNSAFSFGGIANKPNNNEPAKTTATTATLNNATSTAFSFGGAVKSPLTQNNGFGGNVQQNQNNIFNFSGATAAATQVPPKPVNPTFNSFAGSGDAGNNAFVFSGGNNSNSTTAAVATKSPTVSTAATANAFVFGVGANNNSNAATAAPTGNLFALSNNVNNNPAPPYGAVVAANTTATNIFAATSSSDRPIRRATRRLTKF